MKTRDEMIYDFMVALSSNPSMIGDTAELTAHDIYWQAETLADKVLDPTSGSLYGSK